MRSQASFINLCMRSIKNEFKKTTTKTIRKHVYWYLHAFRIRTFPGFKGCLGYESDTEILEFMNVVLSSVKNLK